MLANDATCDAHAAPTVREGAMAAHPTIFQGSAGDGVSNPRPANIGPPQRRERGHLEPPLPAAVDDLASLTRLLPLGADSYTADDVLGYLLAR
jgi:hypothetical protein